MSQYIEDELLKSVYCSIDCSIGCHCGCKYCFVNKTHIKNGYSKKKWRRVYNINLPESVKNIRDKIIEFPAHHDINNLNIDWYSNVLKMLIDNKNTVILTTKTNLKYIKRLLYEQLDNTDKLIVRVSITSNNDDVLKSIEPGASSYESRVEILKRSYAFGYKTHVNIEPMLDESVIENVERISKYVTGYIWVGTPIEKCSHTYVNDMFNELKTNPKVRFRRNIYNVINNEHWKGCLESVHIKRIPPVIDMYSRLTQYIKEDNNI